MRFLFLTDRLSLRGGAGVHLLQVIRWAAAAGHRVTVACGSREPGFPVPFPAEVVRVRGLGSAGASSSVVDPLSVLLSAVDLVHLQNVMNPVAARLAVATGRAVVTVQDHRVLCPGPGKTLPSGERCREVMSSSVCRECLPEAGYRERMLELTGLRREVLAGARLVVLSRYMAEELAAVGCQEAAVIPPWFELGPERRDPGDGFLIGGRLVGHKAPLDGWRSWLRAGRPLPLRLAGAGPLAAMIGGAEDRGWLDAEGLRRELRRARALLFPARWQEPFGMLAVESLAEGTPVIAADVGGTREWSGRGCIVVAPGDPAAMAAAVRRLADEPGLALELGRAGREMVGRRFLRELVEPKLAEVYREASAGRHRSRGGERAT